jgi:hypothetical protein
MNGYQSTKRRRQIARTFFKNISNYGKRDPMSGRRTSNKSENGIGKMDVIADMDEGAHRPNRHSDPGLKKIERNDVGSAGQTSCCAKQAQLAARFRYAAICAQTLKNRFDPIDLVLQQSAESLAELLGRRARVSDVSFGHATERSGQSGDCAAYDPADIRNDLRLAGGSLDGKRQLGHRNTLAERISKDATYGTTGATGIELGYEVEVERIVGAERAASSDLTNANYDEINVRCLHARRTVVDVAGQALNLGVAAGKMRSCDF